MLKFWYTSIFSDIIIYSRLFFSFFSFLPILEWVTFLRSLGSFVGNSLRDQDLGARGYHYSGGIFAFGFFQLMEKGRYTCIQICKYEHIYMYVYILTCTCVCIFCTCLHVCTHTFLVIFEFTLISPTPVYPCRILVCVPLFHICLPPPPQWEASKSICVSHFLSCKMLLK